MCHLAAGAVVQQGDWPAGADHAVRGEVFVLRVPGGCHDVSPGHERRHEAVGAVRDDRVVTEGQSGHVERGGPTHQLFCRRQVDRQRHVLAQNVGTRPGHVITRHDKHGARVPPPAEGQRALKVLRAHRVALYPALEPCRVVRATHVNADKRAVGGVTAVAPAGRRQSGRGRRRQVLPPGELCQQPLTVTCEPGHVTDAAADADIAAGSQATLDRLHADRVQSLGPTATGQLGDAALAGELTGELARHLGRYPDAGVGEVGVMLGPQGEVLAELVAQPAAAVDGEQR